jgi:glycosyltransferase involved in cell wall biosynthesis
VPRLNIHYFYRMALPDGRAHAIQIARATTAFARCGARVTLYLRAGPVPLDEGARRLGLEGVPGLTLEPLRWRRRARLPLARRLGRARLAASGQPVIYLRQVEYYSRFIARFARRLGVPVIYESHNVKSLIQKEARGGPGALTVGEIEQMESEILRSASGIVFTAPLTESLAREHYDFTGPTLLAPNASPAPAPAGAVGVRRDIDILYVGQLYAWKGFDLLLAAIARLPGRSLTVAGGGALGETVSEELRAARGRAEELGVSDRVRFLGQIPPDAVPALMARARVGVIPLPADVSVEARTFTAPLKLFEFWASGVPVVASDLPSIRALVRDGQTGLIVPAEPDSLAKGIDRLLEDPDLARSLAESARREAASYTWEDRASRILDFIDRVI